MGITESPTAVLSDATVMPLIYGYLGKWEARKL